MAEYQRHEPEKTLLHEVVREQLEGFLASSSSREQPAPRFIEPERSQGDWFFDQAPTHEEA